MISIGLPSPAVVLAQWPSATSSTVAPAGVATGRTCGRISSPTSPTDRSPRSTSGQPAPPTATTAPSRIRATCSAVSVWPMPDAVITTSAVAHGVEQRGDVVAVVEGGERLDRVDLGHRDPGAERRGDRRDAVADAAVAGDDDPGPGEVDAGGVEHGHHDRLAGAVDVVEAQLRAGVVDGEAGHGQRAGGGHVAQRPHARRRLLGDAAQVRRARRGAAPWMRRSMPAPSSARYSMRRVEERRRGRCTTMPPARAARRRPAPWSRSRCRTRRPRRPTAASASARHAVFGSSISATPTRRPASAPDDRATSVGRRERRHRPAGEVDHPRGRRRRRSPRHAPGVERGRGQLALQLDRAARAAASAVDAHPRRASTSRRRPRQVEPGRRPAGRRARPGSSTNTSPPAAGDAEHARAAARRRRRRRRRAGPATHGAVGAGRRSNASREHELGVGRPSPTSWPSVTRGEPAQRVVVDDDHPPAERPHARRPAPAAGVEADDGDPRRPAAGGSSGAARRARCRGRRPSGRAPARRTTALTGRDLVAADRPARPSGRRRPRPRSPPAGRARARSPRRPARRPRTRRPTSAPAAEVRRADAVEQRATSVTAARPR